MSESTSRAAGWLIGSQPMSQILWSMVTLFAVAVSLPIALVLVISAEVLQWIASALDLVSIVLCRTAVSLFPVEWRD